MGTGTWSTGLKIIITYLIPLEFLLLFSLALEEKRVHSPVSKLIDLQDEFPLQDSIQSLSIRIPGWLSSKSCGAVYTNPDNKDDHTHTFSLLSELILTHR